MGTLYYDDCRFMKFRWILCRIRNVSDKTCRENQTHFIFKNVSENRVLYEIMWKNMAEPERPHVTIDTNTAHALCMMDNYGYKHRLEIFHSNNGYATRLTVTLYARCLTCFNITPMSQWSSHNTNIMLTSCLCHKMLQETWRVEKYFYSCLHIIAL